MDAYDEKHFDEKIQTEITFSNEIIQIIGSDLIPYGVYNIKNVNSGKYLNLSGGLSGNGVNIQVWDNPQSTDSQWVVCKNNNKNYYTIRSTRSGRFMNLSGGANKNGANIQAWNNPDSTDSQWIIKNINTKKGIFTIENVTNSRFANISGGAKKNGTNVQCWDNPGSSDSQWYFFRVLSALQSYPIYEGMYNIQNVNAAKQYINVSGGKDGNGANVQLWNNPDSQDSQFVIKRVNEKTNLYAIRFSKSQYTYLNISGGSKENGGNVQLWNNPDSHDSRFYFDLIDEKSARVAIRNENSNLYLNCSGAGTKNGTNIQQWSNPQSIESQWYLAALDMRFVGVDFNLDKANKGKQKPDLLLSTTITTSQSSSQAVSWKKTESVQTESWFEYKGGFKITAGFEASGKTGVPFVAEGEVKVSGSVETSHDFSKGNKDIITQTFEWDVPIKAEKGTTVVCSAMITKCKLDVPYIAKFKSKSVGNIITQSGVWHGVSCYDLKIEYKDT